MRPPRWSAWRSMCLWRLSCCSAGPVCSLRIAAKMMSSHRRSVLLLILLMAAIVLPPYLGVYHTRFATQIAIYGMAALSVDLLLGYTGLITFGQAALFGVGAYAAGMLTVYGFTNALVAWPLAILVSML